MKTYLYFIASLLFIMCTNEDVMDKTIFIPDENDDNLPAYTEWGYNSFGAKYERLYFLATNADVPCKITYQDGMLNFYLKGELRSDAEKYYYQREDMTLMFSFPSNQILTYAGLVSLHNVQIDLQDASIRATIERDNNVTDLAPQKGRLFFKRAQLLYIDGRVDRVILSGYFDMQFLINGKPERISDGRFDLGINNDFYYFKVGS
ncbi:MAG: hypothetical protein LBD52_08545 [Prevotellaceae bacterium]|jgi:hypothetical protein|nr:hypothetical protein [Prevotellaceae bacterium]